MIWTEKTLAWGAGLFLLASGALAVTEDSLSSERDYRVIIDRNPFNLKPPVPPAPPQTNPPAPPKEDVLLTGIASIPSLRAYFMTKPPQGKSPEYYSLGPDESRNGLEVLGIDIRGKSVRVKNSGIESVMTFAANGVKAPSGPAPPPGAPGAVPVNPGAMPGAIPPPLTPGGAVTGATTPTTAGAGRIRTIPSRNLRTPAMMGGTAGAVPGAEVSPVPARPDPDAAVQDALRIELQRRANPDITLPPTPGLPQ
jgi:hypothetical protein